MKGTGLSRWVDWPYRGGAALHGALYRRGLVRRQRLGGHTVSVGALHFGGAGKTPLVRALAGAGDAVLIRGYGGRAKGAARCGVLTCPEGATETPVWQRELSWSGGGRPPERRPASLWSAELGDEAVMLAATLPGVPVGVGADRVRAATAVAEVTPVRRWLLDDGFSHHRVARDVDVVVLPVAPGTAGEPCVAAGPWREGRAALGRATAIVFFQDEDKQFQRDTYSSLLEKLNFSGPSAVVAKGPGSIRSFPGGEPLPGSSLRGVPVFAVCGLGRPASFQRQLHALGAVPVGSRWFRDHHRFRPAELRGVELLAAAQGAEVVLTTLKDAVRLPAGWRPSMRWAVMDLALTWERGRDALQEVVEAP